MKKFIKTAAAAITLLSVLSGSALTAWGEEIQLTDYRYESAKILQHDYVLLDYERPLPGVSHSLHACQIWNVPGSEGMYFNSICYQGEYLEQENQRTKRPVSLLSPDGTLAFTPGKYVMYYYVYISTYSKGEFGDSLVIYPNSNSGEYYAAYDIDTHKSGVLDNKGNIVVPFIYTSIKPYFGKYFLAYDAGETTYFKHYYIINPKNGKVLYKYLNSNENPQAGKNLYFYMTEDGEYMAAYGVNGDYAVYSFFDSEGNVIDSGYNAQADECAARFFPEGTEKRNHSDTLIDKEGRVYSVKYVYTGTDDDTDEDTETGSSLRIDEKKIGGKTYYAVFRELEEGENEAGYRAYDEPSSWAKNSVNSLKSEGLLYNESACRYTDNISRLDFAAIAAEVFCKTKGLDVSDYITQNNIEIDYNRFDDTKNVYALLACRLGIMSETGDNTFSPARGISYDEAGTMLNNMSKRLGLSLTFTSADFEGEERPAFSREQAYKNLWRIYEAAVK